jgi:two-component system KDP operon response regulator KdpE
VKPDKILLVEEIQAGRSLRSLLAREGCEVIESRLRSPSGAPAADGYCLILFHVRHPSALLLDVLRLWRDGAPGTTLLVIGNRASSAMRLAVLEAGAAAYLLRPASLPELIARVRAATRRIRSQYSQTPRISFGGRVVDLEAHSISTPAGQIHLTPTECGILRHLALHKNRTVPFGNLVATVWGADPQKGVHSLRRFIRELRQKLEPTPHEPKYLMTDPTIGYRLQTEPEPTSGGKA